MPTQNLGLPFIAPAQAQKHITVNTAFQKLDIAVNISVRGVDISDPPADANEGERFAISQTPTGRWADQGGAIAALQNEVWEFFIPARGTLIWDELTERIYVKHEDNWEDVWTLTDLQNLPQLGVGAQADSTNRLAVASPASLFNHEGAGHQMKINRASATDTASVTFQTDFTGVAEIGLNGTQDLSLKTQQTDGNWAENLTAKADHPGIITPMLSSGQINVEEDQVGEIAVPRSGGIIAIIMAGDSVFPQTAHSGIFAYDCGSSLSLRALVTAGSLINRGSMVLTGTSGDDGDSSISVKAGAILIENRFNSARDYSYSFLV